MVIKCRSRYCALTVNNHLQNVYLFDYQHRGTTATSGGGGTISTGSMPAPASMSADQFAQLMAVINEPNLPSSETRSRIARNEQLPRLLEKCRLIRTSRKRATRSSTKV